MPENREARIKRLLYQSWYRGCKETDGVLGPFAREQLATFNDQQLDEFEAILNEQDWDIWNWVTSKEPMPEDLRGNSVMQMLMSFNAVSADR